MARVNAKTTEQSTGTAILHLDANGTPWRDGKQVTDIEWLVKPQVMPGTAKFQRFERGDAILTFDDGTTLRAPDVRFYQ